MTPIKEIELKDELTEIPKLIPQQATTPIDKGGDADVELGKMQNKLESESVGDGDGASVLERSKEVQINIETETPTDFNNAPVLPLSKISVDVESSMSLPLDDRSVEFSEEKDTPEVSTRVYDFDMVKEKTLPRRMHLGGSGLLQLCSSQPKSHLLAWSLMGTAVMVCVIIFVLYWILA